MVFLRINKLFSLLYILTILASYLAVLKLGFGDAVKQMEGQPERLRDITFKIWESYPAHQHGYLVFLSLDDFNNKVAYSNHSTVYLAYMYVLYKVEQIFPALQMRIMGAFLNMLSLGGVVLFMITQLVHQRICFAKSFLILLSTAFMVTMPDFWISAARSNVDNTFPLIFTFNALAAFFIWRDQGTGGAAWFAIGFLAIFSPISAALFGVALLVYSIQDNGVDIRLVKPAMLAILLGALIYLQALLVAKALGFSTSNSSWIFRSGLDGDTRYFSNLWEAIFAPQFPPRPLHIIAVPFLLALLQMAYLAVRRLLAIMTPETAIASPSGSANMFYYLIFSPYIFTCLFWPQAVSIHPYLYDYLLLAPVCTLLVLNFAKLPVPAFFQFWFLLLLFSISFNLQQIAQAKCSGCFYPAWSINR
jgi:hypothetical protein